MDRDFFSDRFTEDELREFIGATSPRDILASRSPSLKTLGINAAEVSDDTLIRFMIEEPRLIKRPLLHMNGRLIVGITLKNIDSLVFGG